MNDNPTQKPTKRQIKEAIQKLLKGQTEAGERVLISQSVPTQNDKVPRILIYTTSENSTRFNQSPKDYKKVLSCTVECIDRGDSDDELDENLEKLGERVSNLMEKDETLGGLLNKLEYTGGNYAYAEEGSTPMGALALTFDLEYYEDAIKPGSDCLPALETAEVEWNVGPNQEITANDEYNFEQGEAP